MKTIHVLLEDLGACDDAREWAKDYKTVDEIVANCHRGDWLLWLAQKVGMGIKPLTLAKVNCAKTVIHLMKDERSLNALKVAEKFALTDEVTLDDLREASRSAYDAAAYAAAAAAYAWTPAAAAYAAADAAAAAAYAAAAYADAAAAAYAAADARTKNRLETADICRRDVGDLLIKLVNGKLA